MGSNRTPYLNLHRREGVGGGGDGVRHPSPGGRQQHHATRGWGSGGPGGERRRPRRQLGKRHDYRERERDRQSTGRQREEEERVTEKEGK